MAGMVIMQSMWVFASSAAMDSSFNTGIPIGFNNDVKSTVLQSDGKIIIGGDFTTYQWISVNKIIRLNADGSKDTSFDIGDGFDWNVNTITIQTDGKLLVGGEFTTYQWVSAAGIARLNADGSRDSSFDIWDGFDSFVKNITIQSDGKIIAGGEFTTYQWVSAGGIIRLNADGSRDFSFDMWDGFDSFVYSIAIQSDGKILVGGEFTTYQWVSAGGIIRLNADGSRDSSFDMWNGFDWAVYSITVQSDGKIIVGGWFWTYQWVEAYNIIKLNADGSRDSSFDMWEGFDDEAIHTIAVQNDGKIIVGGAFRRYQWVSAGGILRLNADGSRDFSFDMWEGFSWLVLSLVIQDDGKIIAGGWANMYQWIPTNKITRLNANGSRDTTFNIWNGLSWSVEAIETQADGKILVGGHFSSYQLTAANHIIRLNADGSRDTSFDMWEGFDSGVLSLTTQSDGKIIVGGHFRNYQWTAANRIIRLNADGSKDSSFEVWDGFDSTVNTITVQSDGKLLVGGEFTTYQWVSAKGIIRLNADGSRDSSFDMGMGFSGDRFSGVIHTIEIQADGKILVGWYFINYQWVSANWIIRLNADGSRDTTFNIWNGFVSEYYDSASIYAIKTQSDGKIIVGGYFKKYQWVNANHIIRLNTDGSRDTSFDIGNGFDQRVWDIVIENNGEILIGGNFTTYKWVNANHIIRLNTDGSRDTSFDIGDGFKDGDIYIIRVKTDKKILIGGDFTTYQWNAVWHLISLYGNSNVVDLPASNDKAIVNSSFLAKGYTLSNGDLIGTIPISLASTNGDIPVDLTIYNTNISVALAANTQIQKADTTTYNGLLSVPTIKSIASVNNEAVISAFKVGSNSESIKLTWGIATLSIPTFGQTIGDMANIYYAEDNSVSWYPQTKTLVIDKNGEPYVEFSTNHFTDFAVTIPQGGYGGSFVINNSATSTTSQNINLTITMNPTPIQMRFSNNNTSRSSWEAYNTNKSWTLTSDYGIKTVYTQFDTNNDNIGDIEVSDTINYIAPDTTAPIWTISYSTTETTANDVVATLSLNEAATITNNGGNATYTFTGNGAFTFEFTDTSGNTGSTTATVSWIDKTPSNNSGSSSNGGSSNNSYSHNIIPSIIDEVSPLLHKAAEETGNKIKFSWYSTELNNAYLWAHKIGITTQTSIQEANLEVKFYRSHLAKMISEYAVKQLKKTPNTSMKCKFTDIKKQSAEMRIYAQAACELGLMGLKSDGTPDTKFNPNAEVTRAQFGTILSRLLYGTSNNEVVGGERYTSHLTALKKAGIMTKIDKPTMDELRGNVFLMLMRTVK